LLKDKQHGWFVDMNLLIESTSHSAWNLPGSRYLSHAATTFVGYEKGILVRTNTTYNVADFQDRFLEGRETSHCMNPPGMKAFD
jgi:hypothetical protein